MLTRAALHSDPHLLEILLRAKADLNMCSCTGWSVLMSAAVSGSVGLVERILLLSRQGGSSYTSLEDLEISDLEKEVGGALLDHGSTTDASDACTPDHCDYAGHTALIWAARHGHTPVVQCLLEQKASTDLQDERGRTALIWAACHGHMKCVESLLLHRAKLDIQDRSSMSALRWSERNGHHNMQAFLKKMLEAETLEQQWTLESELPDNSDDLDNDFDGITSSP